MSNALIEMLNRKKAALDARGDDFKPHRPMSGKHVYRILPTWRNTDDGEPQPFWHDFGVHWIKAIEGGKEKVKAVFACPDRSLGKECEVCGAIGEAYSRAKALGDDDMMELVKQANAVQKYLLNVLWISNPDASQRTTPVVMEIGSTVFKEIIVIMTEWIAENEIDITSLDKGVALTIERTGTGRDTDYKVNAHPKGSTQCPELKGSLFDLDAIVNAQLSKGNVARAIAGVGAAVGIEIKPALESYGHREVPGLAAPEVPESLVTEAKEVIDDYLVEDAEIVDAVAETKAAPAADADFDLDDLLAGIN